MNEPAEQGKVARAYVLDGPCMWQPPPSLSATITHFLATSTSVLDDSSFIFYGQRHLHTLNTSTFVFDDSYTLWLPPPVLSATVTQLPLLEAQLQLLLALHFNYKVASSEASSRSRCPRDNLHYKVASSDVLPEAASHMPHVLCATKIQLPHLATSTLTFDGSGTLS